MYIFVIGGVIIAVLLGIVFLVEARGRTQVERGVHDHTHPQVVKAINALVREYDGMNRDLIDVEHRLARVEQWLAQQSQRYR
jgi:hypothetical protein